MGVCGHAVVKSAEHGKHSLSSWLGGPAYEWLTGQADLTVYTDHDDGPDADGWNIQTDGLRKAIAMLRKGGTEYADLVSNVGGFNPRDEELALADLLEEGLNAMEKEGTDEVRIDWW